ncbi:methyl-accepting chemotaxis protein [Pseudomonas sp. SJZ079]|uniref:methyl-accepting chemotaxis protein n=1 Tax=Pseudomonas sp. SJZ079 TaxID=2572887 RepID=UPI00119BE992|nr:methyl-accepting chemotaxis protein [Pseudomonas sp. SJZ079]TWC42842.1 methyl-accepting chemotaxis protein [Pseudomonas sp. SJZ079]
MQFFLSWKQKFRLLIIVTLISLGLMAASSFWASQRLSTSLQARAEATAYAGASFALMNDWLKLGPLRQTLTPETQDAFPQRLNALEQRAGQFVAQAQGLGHSVIAESARQIEQLILAETDLQRQWLELSQQLGLSPFTGKRQALANSAEKLEPINIGLIRPFIAAALSNQRDYLATFDNGYADKTEAAIGDMQAKIEELDWRENQIGQAVTGFAEAFAQAHALIQQIREIDTQLASLGWQIEQRIDEQNLTLKDGLLTTTALQAQQARRASHWIMGLSFVGVALFLLLTLSQASRTLMRQLNNVTQLLTQVASGNLTGTLPVGRNPKDEFNQLSATTNRMIQGIGRIVSQVIDANRELAQLHSHLSEAMRRLGENSSQVEIQTEQAASASQQISATINEMAQRSSDVGNATHTAYDSARRGSSIIDASVASMDRLSQLIQATHAQVALLTQSSEKVAGIIDVINSLADQTNLLALNAAIEAARAGDAGRGFSVVADEVRSLAQKTVSATTDIARIVGEFKQQTQSMDELMTSGLSLAAESERHTGQVAGVIEEITQSMERLSGEMNQVVVAIEEISSSTEDIAGKMEEINVHTGETKGLRLNLDQHTRSLSTQVEALNRSAQQFQVD